MAIYHCSVKIIGRSKGKSVIAAAAYRAGEKLYDRETGLTHDFIRKGGVVHREILLSDYAPKEYPNRQIFWKIVTKVEKNSNDSLPERWRWRYRWSFLENYSLQLLWSTLRPTLCLKVGVRILPFMIMEMATLMLIFSLIPDQSKQMVLGEQRRKRIMLEMKTVTASPSLIKDGKAEIR